MNIYSSVFFTLFQSLILSDFHKIISFYQDDSETQRADERKRENHWEREEEIQYLLTTLSAVLTRLPGFYRCSFSVNLGKSESNGVGCVEATHIHWALADEMCVFVRGGRA